MKLTNKLVKAASFFLALILAIIPLSVTADAAAPKNRNNSSVTTKSSVTETTTAPEEEEAPKLISDGIYKLINVSSGKLLEAFDYKFDSQGRMHLDGRRNAVAQNFAIISHGDGTYSLCPQNDDGMYMMEYRTDAGVGSSLYKSTENNANTRFRITENADGTFRISPASSKLAAYSLAESKTNIAFYQYSLCELQKSNATTSQRWRLELTDSKIEISVSLNKSEETVKRYTMNKLYAVVKPAAYSDLVTWSSDNKKVAIVDDDGSYCAFAVGTANIYATVGEKTVSCKVTVSEKNAFTWYSQCNMYNGGWNALALKNLYFSAYGYTKPFMIDGFNGRTDWMDEGCALCCAAMVLNNLNAKITEGYDFRSGKEGGLDIDPYTAALANTYNHGSATGSGVLPYDPIYTAMSLIASRSNVNGKSLTPRTYYYFSKQDIKEQLDKHPEGIIIGMDSYWRGSHYIVITECVNPDAENPNDYKFLVCDPAAYDAKDGNNVLFEESTSYKELYYRDYDMWSLIVFNVQD